MGVSGRVSRDVHSRGRTFLASQQLAHAPEGERPKKWYHMPVVNKSDQVRSEVQCRREKDKGEIAAYLNWVRSPEGQKIVKDVGYYPLPENLQEK